MLAKSAGKPTLICSEILTDVVEKILIIIVIIVISISIIIVVVVIGQI